jgi:hypothetical protein
MFQLQKKLLYTSLNLLGLHHVFSGILGDELPLHFGGVIEWEPGEKEF